MTMSHYQISAKFTTLQLICLKKCLRNSISNNYTPIPISCFKLDNQISFPYKLADRTLWQIERVSIGNLLEEKVVDLLPNECP